MRHCLHLKQDGVAMIMVLWVVSLMTIMAASYALSTQREAAILSHAHERAKATALAEGAIHYAMLMLTLPDQKTRWKADGTPYVWEVEGARVHIAVMDEGGKIDLNGAQEPTLRAILNLILHNDEASVKLTDAILDWRDGDDIKRLHGAESAEYKAADTRQGPQNRNFLVVDELRSVLGMTPEIFRQLLPWFTVYTGQDGLNPAKAPRDILLKLARGDVAAVDNYLLQRSLGNPAPFAPVPGINYQASADLAYTVEARAAIGGQLVAGIRSTLKRSQGMSGGAPFIYLTWREQGYAKNKTE
jgi:general secretion pathway protein K